MGWDSRGFMMVTLGEEWDIHWEAMGHTGTSGNVHGNMNGHVICDKQWVHNGS